MKLSDRILRFELNDTNSLLINPMTGAIDIIPSIVLKDMEDADSVSAPNDAIAHLANRGYFLSEDERMEKLRDLQHVNEEHQKNVPYWFYILSTLKCNFGCPICYERNVLENSDISCETITKIISFVKRFQEEKNISKERIRLVMFGGDPLCVSDRKIIEQILESSSKMEWKTIIVTNGSNIKKFMDAFIQYRDAISDFRITLDGEQKIHDARRPYRDGRGSFNDVIRAIDLLLENKFTVKMQTIIGAGNISRLDELILFAKDRGWLQNEHFHWRIEGSHDYANFDPKKDEISEGKIVRKLAQSWKEHEEIRGKTRFESFKYLGHITRSFGWLGDYKTYWGPKYGFCEPQKGFHYVFSVDGKIYHCPRTINDEEFYIGTAFYTRTLDDGFQKDMKGLKDTSILERGKCLACSLNTLCGGGCVVQKKYYPDMDCRKYALSIISEFISLMKEDILERASPNEIVSVNNLWI